MRIIAFAIAALVTLVGRIGAQSVPDFSFGLAAGSGAHTLHAPSVYYISERAAMFRASGTLALARHGLVRPILTIDATASCLGFCAPRMTFAPSRRMAAARRTFVHRVALDSE